MDMDGPNIYMDGPNIYMDGPNIYTDGPNRHRYSLLTRTGYNEYDYCIVGKIAGRKLQIWLFSKE